MCGYWNSYVATSTIVSRQCFYAASSNWCRDQVLMLRQHVCLVLVATMFLVLSAFLLRPEKSVATESCRHLSFVAIRASLSRQTLPCVDILLKNLVAT